MKYSPQIGPVIKFIKIKKEENKYTATFKARIALGAIKEEKTISEIASEHGIHLQLFDTNWL